MKDSTNIIKRLNMKFIQDKLEQPSENATLMRYMDQRFFDDFIRNGICFASVAIQEDKQDGKAFTKCGLQKMINNNDKKMGTSTYREKCYISCWKIQEQVTKKDFNDYCMDEKTNIGYAVKVNYRDLIKYVDSNCKSVNGSKYFRGYFVNWGKVKYHKLKNRDLPKDDFIELETYYKDKKKYKQEKEFRIKLTTASAKFIPNNDNYLISNKLGFEDKKRDNVNIKIRKMYSAEWEDFLKKHCKVVEYNKETRDISKEKSPRMYIQ